MDNRERIAAALTALLQRQTDNAFVIIENPQTEQFVQFAGSANDPLMLDLPAQALNEVEFERAKELFQSMGIAGQTSELLDRPGGEVTGEIFTFNAYFQSVPDAVDMVEVVFRKVYELSLDGELSITEN